MIVRKIKPEELKRTKELFATAFEFAYENQKTADQVYEETRNSPKSREDERPLDKYAAFEEDDKTMMSCLSVNTYEMNFDGCLTEMAGIGGVSSLPQYRRKGGIRGCFERMLADLYANGTDFSYLYPFSSVYYRKFGYEMGCFGRQCNYLLSMIPDFDLKGGYFVLVDESNREQVLTDVKKLYGIWESRYNGMIHNESYEYAFVTEANPYLNQQFTYLYYLGNGRPAAYFTLHKEKKEEGQILICNRLVYAGKEGLQGFLSLVKTMASDHIRVIFTIPASETMEFLVKEWSLGAFSETRIPLGMVRVVNVESVLKKAVCRGSGELILGIRDNILPQNSGNYRICFMEGVQNRVERMPQEQKPQVRMDIADFSHGIFRGFHGEELSDYDSVELSDPQMIRNGAIRQIFYPKKNYIMEYF